MSPATKIDINRDIENDILYVMNTDFDPNETVNQDIDSNIIIRKDHKTRQVVGFIIDDFSKVAPDWAELKDYDLMEKFENLLEGLNYFHLSTRLS